jgi:hypothetical protein
MRRVRLAAQWITDMQPMDAAIRAVACAVLLACTNAYAATAATFVPPADDVIVERLPASSAAQRARRDALRARADDLPLALETASDAMRRARRSGDPRDLGEAQAALSAWWSLAAPPPAVRLMRANILQSRHRFDAAVAELDALLPPANATDASIDANVRWQAWLARAAVHQVQGQLDAAKADCEALSAELRAAGSRAAPFAPVVLACLAELRSLQGDPQAALRALAALQVQQPNHPWLALLRAELAQRLGQPLEAARLLEPFTSAADAEIYIVAAHADALLESGQTARALALVDARRLRRDAADAPLPEALQLRRAVALARLGQHDDARAQARTLRAALDSARQRGDVAHLREEAWLALDVEGDAALAWQRAQANWQTQREPIDALLLVRAATAAKQPAQARDFAERRRAEGWHDLRLAQALEASR